MNSATMNETVKPSRAVVGSDLSASPPWSVYLRLSCGHVVLHRMRKANPTPKRVVCPHCACIRTLAELRRLASLCGAKLEEDDGYRDVRVFQLVAPRGKRWRCGLLSIRVEWAKGSTVQAEDFNRKAFTDAAERVKLGCENIPDKEAELYAED